MAKAAAKRSGRKTARAAAPKRAVPRRAPASRGRAAPVPGAVQARVVALVKALPAEVEQMEVVRRTTELIGQGEEQATHWLAERQADAQGAVTWVNTRTHSWADLVRAEGKRASKALQTRRHQMVETVEQARTTVEQQVDAVLWRVGLMRRSVHEREVARIKRAKKARKAPATRTRRAHRA